MPRKWLSHCRTRRVIADKTGKPATLRRVSPIAPAGFIVAKRHVGGAGRHSALAAFLLACRRCGPLCYRQHGPQYFFQGLRWAACLAPEFGLFLEHWVSSFFGSLRRRSCNSGTRAGRSWHSVQTRKGWPRCRCYAGGSDSRRTLAHAAGRPRSDAGTDRHTTQTGIG